MRTRTAKVVSVAFELTEVMHAVEAAQLLAKAVQQGALGDDRDESAAPAAVSATLSLVAVRLRDLVRAISGSTNPATFLAAHNTALPLLRELGGQDIHLEPWTDKQVEENARRELRRVRNDRKVKRRTR